MKQSNLDEKFNVKWAEFIEDYPPGSDVHELRSLFKWFYEEGWKIGETGEERGRRRNPRKRRVQAKA